MNGKFSHDLTHMLWHNKHCILRWFSIPDSYDHLIIHIVSLGHDNVHEV